MLCNIARFTEGNKLELLEKLNVKKEICIAESVINPVFKAVQFCEEFTRRNEIYDAYTENCQCFAKKFIRKFVPDSKVQWDKIPYDAEAVNKLGVASKLGSSATGK